MKKLIISFTMFVLTSVTMTLTVDASSINESILTYDFTNNSTIVEVAGQNRDQWRDFIYEYNIDNPNNRIFGTVSDFVDECTLTIEDPFEINIEVPASLMKTFDVYSYGQDSSGKGIGLFSSGSLKDNYNTFYYHGLSSYGDTNHRNGTNVIPFFLFMNGTGTAHAPNQFKYNPIKQVYVAKFLIDLPRKTAFTIGLSFSCIYEEFDYGEENYYKNHIYSSEIINSSTLYINV